METARLAFWCLMCLFLVPFIAVAWIVLFWVSSDRHEKDEDDGFSWDEDITEEYDRAA